MIRGGAALLVLVGIALLARRLGADGYGGFAIAAASAAIFLGPILPFVAATVAGVRGRVAMLVAAVLAAVLSHVLVAPHVAVAVCVLAAALALWDLLWRETTIANDVTTARPRVVLVALSALGVAVLHWSDRFFLAYRLDATEVGIYAAAVDLSQCLFVPLTSLVYLAWLPQLASPMDRVRDEMRYAIAVFALLLPVLTVVILARAELVDAVFGAAYSTQVLVLPWVAIAAVVGALRHAVLDTGLYRAGRLPSVARAIAAGAFVNVALNAFYVPRYGVIAAVGAALVGQSLAFFLAWRASRDIIEWRIPRVDFERVVFCCGAMAFVVLLLPRAFGFASKAGIAAFVYAASMFLVNGAGFRNWARGRATRMD
ncbi:MAG TPA: polysaccharide biosynthesis C-terminal domain-containing protein [Pseudomonadales bacterium]